MADVIAELRALIARSRGADAAMVDTAHLAALLDVAEAARSMQQLGAWPASPEWLEHYARLSAALARLEGR